MDHEEYRWRGKEMVDYISQYLTNIRERRVYPDVQPGYMRHQLPHGAPLEPESWDNIFRDVEKIIMPGVVHWQSPQMHAYFPALTSWPSLLGDMLADAINCLGFTWASSPACTELEMNVMDWLAQMMGLPETFLHYHPSSKGGGILQSTVSESTLIALLAARKNKILEMKTSEPSVDDSTLNSRLIAYASDQDYLYGAVCSPTNYRQPCVLYQDCHHGCGIGNNYWLCFRKSQGTEMAKYFESLLRSNPLFEIPAKRHLGLVVFRLKGPNWMTKKLLQDLNKSGKLFVIPATVQEKLIIRFTVTSQFTTREDIQQDWALIQQTAANISSQSLLIPEEKAPAPNQLIHSGSKAACIPPPIFTEKEKVKMVPLARITTQPRRGSLNSSLSLLNGYIPKAKEPHLDEVFTENSRRLTNCDLPSVLSLSAQSKKKTARSFSLDSPFENIPCASRKFFSKLPKEILMVKKEDLKKPPQFYHMPSFPECTIQCGLQLPCCPLQTII
ncbi:PREDICTED: histidine decarboxylase-like [Thamnophis sirtalis]|uniref:Histidine decarboxylase n=1 Tax=Thamnophis sirtalis TaxID=35019 RepID=A0A6I9XS52_9SAUR|nr:PREDICTED: histidine decarboxylase-like [Thamnophis sirtalis]